MKINLKNYILHIVPALFLVACNSGGGSGSTSSPAPSPVSQLTTYPPSGQYVGTADSSKGQGFGTAKGSISGSTAAFTVYNKIGLANIDGSFQLNNDTCFAGSENINGYVRAFIVTNCTYADGVITGSYENGFSDAGALELTLQ